MVNEEVEMIEVADNGGLLLLVDGEVVVGADDDKAIGDMELQLTAMPILIVLDEGLVLVEELLGDEDGIGVGGETVHQGTE